jgi:hypothetical protein
MNQVTPSKSRAEVLKTEYSLDEVSSDVFDWAMDALLALGIADEPCPYSPGEGFKWYGNLTLWAGDVYPIPSRSTSA